MDAQIGKFGMLIIISTTVIVQQAQVHQLVYTTVWIPSLIKNGTFGSVQWDLISQLYLIGAMDVKFRSITLANLQSIISYGKQNDHYLFILFKSSIFIIFINLYKKIPHFLFK